MDLTQSTWMIRDLGQPVSAVRICPDKSIIAGGWDGKLSHWDSDGKLLWSTDCMDRIESICQIESKFIVTSGLHIVCVENGEQIWAHPLEGSADLLSYFDGEIIATSSVYDIEHGDFMESAIWKFSLEGELNSVEKIDERPWFMSAKEELIIGLGRPKCGLLVNGNRFDLGTDSPVMCGMEGNDGILLGHADGTISKSTGEIVITESSGIESIIPTENGYTTALEDGTILARNTDTELLWKIKKNQITTQSTAFSYHWLGNWDGMRGSVEVRDNLGELVTSQNTSRPRVSSEASDRICFGFEDGQILVWEKELFERRKTQEVVVQDEKKSALAAKLRSLRK